MPPRRIIPRRVVRRLPVRRAPVRRQLARPIRRGAIRPRPVARPAIRVRGRVPTRPRPSLRTVSKVRSKPIPKPKIMPTPPPPPPPPPPPTPVYPVNIVRSRREETQPSMLDAQLRSIGTTLIEPLRPTLIKANLYNKTYRMDILVNHIDKLPIMDDLACPFLIMFAISIRPDRFQALQARLGKWSPNLHLWQGTVGSTLDKADLVQKELAVSRLTRGQIGCYDSHYRLWSHMVENQIADALIMEDDADIHYGQYTVLRMKQMFEELKHVEYDLVYVGHNNYKAPRKMVRSNIGVPAGVQGLFMYYITLEGARKLLENAIPITQPVDDYVFVQQNHIRQFTLEPRLGWVVPVESDTSSIK